MEWQSKISLLFLLQLSARHVVWHTKQDIQRPCMEHCENDRIFSSFSNQNMEPVSVLIEYGQDF